MCLKAALAILSLLALAACSPSESPAGTAATTTPTAGTADQAEAQPGWDYSQLPVAGARLAFSPDPTDFCTESLQKITVHWELPDGYGGPQIWVQTGTAPKLFAAIRGSSGEVVTGTWVRSSTVFHLIDATTGTVLYQASPNAAPCP